jgi:hypothetical protein
MSISIKYQYDKCQYLYITEQVRLMKDELAKK